ncbi:dipeptidase [Aliikangiella maris]|uniref:Dipeptidase n=2 Tax=Aliikangiella maris TaxID=3162458 RepID=A0ABV2BWI0_9GAMM
MKLKNFCLNSALVNSVLVKGSVVAICSALFLAGCQDKSNESASPAQVSSEQSSPLKSTQAESVQQKNLQAKTIQPLDAEQAKMLAKKYIIVDTHIDVPFRLDSEYEDVAHATPHGDFDYPRAVNGGLDAPFMSIFIPASYEEKGGSYQKANELIDIVEGLVKANPDKYALAYSTKDVMNNFKQGIISLPMGMENGSPIEGKLENLAYFFNRGIRYITLAHSKANHISDSSYDENRPAKGLTEFGKKLVKAMNDIGMMIDVSHISDEAFYQVMKISQTSVIASHSSARHFTPGFERNMSDDMIKLLAKNGGVIQINFGSGFVSQKSIEHWNTFKQAREDFIKENNVERYSDEVKAFSKAYREKNPYVYATLNDVLDHFDHVVKLVGIDYVGIGSDYDGVGDSLPNGLKDVASYPNLIQGLSERGYTEQDIAKILSGNVMRVWRQVEEYAEQQKLAAQ